MPSPFPGMDPYLEDPKLWPEFHHQFLACLHQILLPALVDRYEARIGERAYTIADTYAEPGLLGGHREEFIEIRSRADGKLITLIDVVSLANKRTATGQAAYLNTRREAV